jgi:hypothetical protein
MENFREDNHQLRKKFATFHEPTQRDEKTKRLQQNGKEICQFLSDSRAL